MCTNPFRSIVAFHIETKFATLQPQAYLRKMSLVWKLSLKIALYTDSSVKGLSWSTCKYVLVLRAAKILLRFCRKVLLLILIGGSQTHLLRKFWFCLEDWLYLKRDALSMFLSHKYLLEPARIWQYYLSVPEPLSLTLWFSTDT